MKSCIIALAFCALVVADVSHLASQYLPPVLGKSITPSNSQITTTIEKQELRELPEQIESIREGDSPLSVLSQAAPMQKLLTTATPKAVQVIPAPEYLPPSFHVPVPMSALDIEMSTEHIMIPKQYLPPSAMLAYMQPNYRQYQEKLVLMQRAREMMMMMMSPINSQPVAPSDLESSIQEPSPAHRLHDDGYHYKISDIEKGFAL